MITHQTHVEAFNACSTIKVDEKKPSMLYNVLPTILQNRIPRLPSIRRALNDIRSPAPTLQASRNASEASLPQTPPPDYTSRAASVAASQQSSNRNSFDTAEEDELYQGVGDTPMRSFSTMSTPPRFAVSETRTGINWKYANQGVSLSNQAHTESQTRHPSETSLILTRQMYIHSLTYLLRGLPNALSPEETLSLQAALPPSMLISAPCSHDISFSLSEPRPQAPPADPSLLHRLIATLIFETFVLLQFLLPYLKVLLGHAYRFERKHHLAQRVVNSGITSADAVRRTGLQLTHMVCQMNDGKVGLALTDMSLWVVKGVTGGLQQGIQDGVILMSEEREEEGGHKRRRSVRGKNGA